MNLEEDKEKYKADPYIWVSTLPSYSKRDTKPKTKKYSIGIILFVIGLVLVSIIKNETRNLHMAWNSWITYQLLLRTRSPGR